MKRYLPRREILACGHACPFYEGTDYGGGEGPPWICNLAHAEIKGEKDEDGFPKMCRLEKVEKKS